APVGRRADRVRPEVLDPGPGRIDERDLVHVLESRPVRHHLDRPDLPLAPFAVEDATPVLLRQAVLAVDPPLARRAAAEVVDHRQYFLGVPGERPRVAVEAVLDDVHEARVPAVAVVGVVADEDAVVLVHRHVQVIARAAGEHLQARAVRPEADDAAAFQADEAAVLGPPHAALGDLDAVGDRVAGVPRHLRDTLVADGNIEPAIHAHANAAGHVVVESGRRGALGAAVGEEVLAPGRLALGIEGEDGDVGVMDDVELVADDVHAHDGPHLLGDEDALRRVAALEHPDLVNVLVAG